MKVYSSQHALSTFFDFGDLRFLNSVIALCGFFYVVRLVNWGKFFIVLRAWRSKPQFLVSIVELLIVLSSMHSEA
jgi:hypothetical protein